MEHLQGEHWRSTTRGDLLTKAWSTGPYATGSPRRENSLIEWAQVAARRRQPLETVAPALLAAAAVEPDTKIPVAAPVGRIDGRRLPAREEGMHRFESNILGPRHWMDEVG